MHFLSQNTLNAEWMMATKTIIIHHNTSLIQFVAKNRNVGLKPKHVVEKLKATLMFFAHYLIKVISAIKYDNLETLSFKKWQTYGDLLKIQLYSLAQLNKDVRMQTKSKLYRDKIYRNLTWENWYSHLYGLLIYNFLSGVGHFLLNKIQC